MYIDADFIIKAASLLSALGALVAAVVAVYKVLENNKKQNEFINAMQEEQMKEIEEIISKYQEDFHKWHEYREKLRRESA